MDTRHVVVATRDQAWDQDCAASVSAADPCNCRVSTRAMTSSWRRMMKVEGAREDANGALLL